MICEKCGKQINNLLIDTFLYDGSDTDISHDIQEDETAVWFETTQNWAGYELTEEEQRERIICPYCKQFPFKHQEVQVIDVVRVICFKTEKGEKINDNRKID